MNRVTFDPIIRRAFFLVPLSIVAVGLFCICTRDHQKETRQEEIRELQLAVSQMATRYGVVSNLEDAFDPDFSIVSRVHTVQLEEALVLPNDAPVLFQAELLDVSRQDGQYLASFGHAYSYQFDYPNIYFELECSAEQVKEICEHSTGEMFGDFFAVVAQIHQVRKAKFAVRAPLPGDPEFPEFYDLEIETSGLYIATGKCVDFISLGLCQLEQILTNKEGDGKRE